MIRRLIFAFGAVAIAAMASAPSRAEEPDRPSSNDRRFPGRGVNQVAGKLERTSQRRSTAP